MLLYFRKNNAEQCNKSFVILKRDVKYVIWPLVVALSLFVWLCNVYRVRYWWGRVLFFNQSEARKQCFKVYDWLRYGTLPHQYRTLLLISSILTIIKPIILIGRTWETWEIASSDQMIVIEDHILMSAGYWTTFDASWYLIIYYIGCKLSLLQSMTW